MNKYMISQGSALLGAEFIAESGGFTAGNHDKPLIGYFCRSHDDNSEDWNTAGHGLTYDLAIVSLYMLKKHGELPPPKEHFYLDN